ncbi:MAG: UDP-glucose--hexose-1-phosphate uridylyltransferase [Chloroflexi bacterium AL-W]|nr:UDP-glucose--hexose-1-phosphate uridylyltransferase [Chloroflexi bacterium AL-N1]NOK65350.1 UDP-glucose--hexose-1-phosphate uridylyltransferase [Chloroflexi bacterium AL-N10]NOK72384.1 UDP-glucose--hexose-1-phosphate uridylyltransferase [Chloroflexi bacterium AL-N5]NOK79529.1 UDP-glucose--hexose-1-phosphate uridylyltransferase [Chloroflexi bacterium AL-W]NOK87445.1 UDP-glucose--hexose-1-phosphate uridylyltransferase [Chloroflexi bacterium AL-N15]
MSGISCAELRHVVDTWSDQYVELGGIPWVCYVQIFENRGVMMGASNPHPHGQIWANESILNEPAKELHTQQTYMSTHDRCLLCDYLAEELGNGQRLICQNDHFVALVPFWAVWPFTMMVLPRVHCGALSDLPSDARDGLADMLKQVPQCYDRLFQVSFPYSRGFINTQLMGMHILHDICILIFICPCYAGRQYVSLWSGMNCWANRNVILPLNTPPNASVAL